MEWEMAWLLYMSFVCWVDKIYKVVEQAKRGKDEGGMLRTYKDIPLSDMVA